MFHIRKLESSDYHRQYINLLKQLSPSSNIDVTFSDFIHQFNHIQKNNINIYVIEHENKIIASATLIIEHKFIHNCKNVGHIEDVVVDKMYRGNRLAQRLVEFMIDYSRKHNCYKIILNCSEDYKKFYEKFEFEEKNIQMAIYF